MKPQDVRAYFDRIGYGGVPRIDLDTLNSLMVRHVTSISFENLDVQLGRIPSLSIDAIFEKIVRGGRGGWCYEMNGLFGWALSQIGFDVTRITGGVNREALGDPQLGNHLALLVKLDQPYLVDVGFGSVLTKPLPLAAHTHHCTPYEVALAVAGAGYWRYSEKAFSEPSTFDFKPEPADENLLADKCRWQATHENSNFVRNIVVQRRRAESHLALRGKVLTETHATGVSRRVLTHDEWLQILGTEFGLNAPGVEMLWPRVGARHAELFGTIDAIGSPRP